MRYRLPEPISEKIQSELGAYSGLVRQLLVNRGITSADQAKAFLEPIYSDISSPWDLNDMQKAITRIISAIKNGEQIAVYADYDADGVPGCVLLKNVFDAAGVTNVIYYIPHRHDEGYGLNREAVTELAEKNVKVIITVDLGITGHDDVAYLNTRGVDVIITDHHEPLATLPDAFAVVNPKVGGSYGDPMICGCAVAYQLSRALIEQGNKELNWNIAEGWEKWLLDLVGISTISDLVPLVNENRLLATYGLKVLQKTKRKGLQQLLLANGVAPQYITEDDIAFGITPKLNAASRMAHPMDAFKLLAATKDAEARAALEHIEGLNKERKTLVAHSVKTARAMLDARQLREVIVIGHPEWNIGVLGLIASNLVDAYQRPVFVWSKNADGIKGSCRGDGTVNVVRMMESAGDAFLQFGGHEHAGGFSVSFDAIHTLEDVLVSVYQSCATGNLQDVEAILDGALLIDDINRDTIAQISQLAPFGMANPKPVFVFNNITVREAKQFGKKNEHLDLVFENSFCKSVRAIKFYAIPADFPALENRTIDLIANIEKSVFRGREEIRLKIMDVLPGNSV